MRLHSRVTGALAGQVGLAASGLVLQLAAARQLGAAGLATFSVLYGGIVLLAALSSGLVGDSLTVLDRHDPRVRAALQTWEVLLLATAGLGGGVLAAALGVVGGWGAVALGVAAVAFVLEDVLRRLLMATGRFWDLPLVDGTSLLVSLGVLLAAGVSTGLTLTSFLVALGAGQLAACLVAWLRLPAGERPTWCWRSPALLAVLGFGGFRAVGQGIRPTLLTVLRLVVVGAVGAAAYGPLEAARVYTAPALVLAVGTGSFLLPWFAGQRDRPPAAVLRLADRVAAGATAVVLAVGLGALLLLPWAGPLLTGGGYEVPPVAVAGWAVYAAVSAALLPYATLASVHRRQRAVLAWRSLELVSVVAVVVLVLAVPGGSVWTPFALVIGPVAAAVAIRGRVLGRLAAAGGAPTDVPVAPGPALSPAVG